MSKKGKVELYGYVPKGSIDNLRIQKSIPITLNLLLYWMRDYRGRNTIYKPQKIKMIIKEL